MNTKAKFYELFESLFETTKKYETMYSWALALKLGEEVGEFQEAVLKDYSFLRHKEDAGHSWLEAADIINVLIGFLAVHYPEMTAQELTEKLYEAIATKGDKYKGILTGTRANE